MVMPNDQKAVMRTFPPCELSPLERDLVREWLGLALDVPNAYVSTRRSDDPALFRRIFVSETPDGRPTHLIHHADGFDSWIKMTIGPSPEIAMFGTLRAALNSIRQGLFGGA
jgi:hypothetical protein